MNPNKAARWIARSLRFSVVTAAYKHGDVTREQAIKLLSGPLSPDDVSTVYDDSKLIDKGIEGLQIIEESEEIEDVKPSDSTSK